MFKRKQNQSTKNLLLPSNPKDSRNFQKTILKVINLFIKNKPKLQHTRYKTKTEVK